MISSKMIFQSNLNDLQKIDKFNDLAMNQVYPIIDYPYIFLNINLKRKKNQFIFQLKFAFSSSFS